VLQLSNHFRFDKFLTEYDTPHAAEHW